MIDIKSKIVLNILSKETKNGGYKIFDLSDIIMSMPKHYRADKESVKHMLFYLERQDAISIKYDEDDKFCIAVLPYGYELLENEKPSFQGQKHYTEKEKNQFVFPFLSALLGSIIGSMIISLIFYLI